MSLSNSGGHQMDDVRVLVVGDCGSGKSSFTATLVGKLNSSGTAGLSVDHCTSTDYEYERDSWSGSSSNDINKTSGRNGLSRRASSTSSTAGRSSSSNVRDNGSSKSSTVGCALSCFILERTSLSSAASNQSPPAPSIQSSSSESSGTPLMTSSHARRPLLVELLEVGAHERFTKLRRLFYQSNPVDGVIVVFDVSSRRTQRSVSSWIEEIREYACFSRNVNDLTQTNQRVNTADLDHSSGSTSFGILPVPVLIVGNKDDLCDEEIRRRRRELGVSGSEYGHSNSHGKGFIGMLAAALVRIRAMVYAFLVRVTAPMWLLRFLFVSGNPKSGKGKGKGKGKSRGGMFAMTTSISGNGNGNNNSETLLASTMSANQYRGPMTRACSTKGRVDRIEIDTFFEKCITAKNAVQRATYGM